MYRLAALLFLATSYAKIINPKYDYILFEHSNSVVEPNFGSKPVPTGSAWVVRLDDDVEALKLRVATPAEVEEVFPASKFDSGPSPRQGRRLKKDDPNQPMSSTAAPEIPKDADEKSMISDIMRVINKFALTSNDPDVYITGDNQNSSSLQLYFKNEHTSLIVKARGRRWQYVIGPPTVIPEWFYEEHTTDGRDAKGAFVEIPKNVKMEFYGALTHMLTMFMSFPV